LWQAISGPLTVLLIAYFFTPAEQGFYFTFSSILGLQVFFEMGLAFVLLQFASHAFSALLWLPEGGISGEPQSLKKFHHFVYSSIKWYGIVSVFFSLALVPAGIFFLAQHAPPANSFSWILPWILLVLSSSLNLSLSPIFSIAEGSRKIEEVVRVRLVQGIVGTIASWATLLGGGGLYFAVANSFSAFCVGLYWALIRRPELIDIYLKIRHEKFKYTSDFSWRNEIWPLQWRIAISWGSGYFINQLFTPLLFHFNGPVDAGRMGMTLTVINIMGGIALSWISTKMPVFGNLIVKKDWKSLDALFWRSFRESLFVLILGFSGILFLLLLIQNFPTKSRLLPGPQIVILLAAFIGNHIIASLALYLRAHKKDPFVWLSLGGAFLMGMTSFALGKNYGSLGICAGIFMVNIFYGLPTTLWVWYNLKKSWHS
jgi:hypothetical protein